MVQDNKGLEDALGIFYGLFPTYYGIGVGELDDFCDDTYTAAYSNMSLEKWTYQEDGNHLYKNGNEIYYNSYQIMDVLWARLHDNLWSSKTYPHGDWKLSFPDDEKIKNRYK